MIGIYIIRNVSNGKCYIGKSETDIKKRWQAHLTLLNNNKHYNVYLQRAYNKYPESFEFDILENCSLEECDEREKYWINKFNSYDRSYGYNLTYGGEGGLPTEETLEKIRITSLGRTHSEEAKRKMAESKKGKPRSKEVIIKLTQSKIGKPSWNKGKTGIFSDETLRKIGEASKRTHKNNPLVGEKNGMFGKEHSEETKKKMSESKTKEKHFRYISFTSEQEVELMALKEEGKTTKELAAHFNVSSSTIERRVRQIMKRKGELNS
jgi:group I intron endonuclease